MCNLCSFPHVCRRQCRVGASRLLDLVPIDIIHLVSLQHRRLKGERAFPQRFPSKMGRRRHPERKLVLSIQRFWGETSKETLSLEERKFSDGMMMLVWIRPWHCSVNVWGHGEPAKLTCLWSQTPKELFAETKGSKEPSLATSTLQQCTTGNIFRLFCLKTSKYLRSCKLNSCKH